MAQYDDPTGQTRFDMGLHYADAVVPTPPSLERIRMADKLLTDYSDLDAPQTHQLLVAHDTAMDNNAHYPAPVPAKADVTAMITRIEQAIADQAAAEAAYKNANTVLQDAVVASQRLMGQRATNCNSVTPGNKEALLTTGLRLAGERQPAGPTPRVQNVGLSIGDQVGYVDVDWDSLRKKAKTYQVQSCTNMGADPNTATWADHDPVPKSKTTIGPFTSGTRIWVRVRAIGTNGPGDWSDPATIIVP